MNLADVFTVVLSVAGLLTVLVGWWLAVAGLFPRLVESCADKLGTAPLRCFAIGVAWAVPLIFGLVGLGKFSTSPVAKFLSVALVMVTVLLALAGTAGLALRIGRGMAAATDGDEKAALARIAQARQVYIDARNNARKARTEGDAAAAQALLSDQVRPAVSAYLSAQQAYLAMQQAKESGRVDWSAVDNDEVHSR